MREVMWGIIWKGTITVGLLLLSAANWAEESSAEPVAVKTFVPPKRVFAEAPEYPRISQRRGHEGWVQLSYMINPEGKPYDITVVDSSDNHRFEDAAIKAAAQWRYDPAELDGQAIDAGTSGMITFELSGGAVGATSAFITNYRSVGRHVKSGDRQKAEKALARLENQKKDLYEEAYYQLARYTVALAWGNEREQYTALRKATARDGKRGFLPDELLTQMLIQTLRLELKLNLVTQARVTANILKERELAENVKKMVENIHAQTQAIKESGKPFLVNASIDGTNRAVYRLTHPTFSLLNVEGDIAELRLHCQKGYVGFAFDPELSYSVEPDWGWCNLSVIGSPDTEFVIKDGG